jgi:hypothetical protein
MDLVDEDVYIKAKLLEPNIQPAAKADGVRLWENMEHWLGQQNGSLQL